jgi:hypothetical protein
VLNVGDETQLPAQVLPMPRMRQSKSCILPLVHRTLTQPPPRMRRQQINMARSTVTFSELSWDCLSTDTPSQHQELWLSPSEV